MRLKVSSGAKWEDIVGYSRAVKVNNQVFITGTVAVDADNNLVGGNSAYLQTQFILQKIEKVLQQCGASLSDVVRTRLFVTDISRWEEYGKAHGEVFGTIRPCTTMVEVSKLIAPEYLIEIEVDAVME